MENKADKERAIITERINCSKDAISALSGNIEKSVVEVADILKKLVERLSFQVQELQEPQQGAWPIF